MESRLQAPIMSNARWWLGRLRAGGPGLVWLLSLTCILAQTNRTWNGSASTDWFNPANWTPAGVPASNDIVNATNAAINLSSPVTIAGQFNWAGGTLSGSPLTIASDGVLNLSGTSTLFLENSLTNAGTVNWAGPADLNVQNEAGVFSGVIENLAGGLWDIENNQRIFNNNCCVGVNPYFRNAGTVRKLAGTNTTSIQIPFYNAGGVVVQAGTLDLDSGGTVEGSFSAAAEAVINWAGGAFSYQNEPVLSGPGTIELIGGTLTLVSNTIANLALLGGTISLGTNFQGGSITNLTLPGSTLSGNYTVSGALNCNAGATGALLLASGATMNWIGGTMASAITIASNATLSIIGSNTFLLQAPLTNAGTVTWGGPADLDVQSDGNTLTGQIQNLAGGLWNIENDQNLYNNACCRGSPYFANAGTIVKSANTGTTTCSIPFFNTGFVTNLQGTINFAAGGLMQGQFDAELFALIVFSGGAFNYSTTPVMTGEGSIDFTGGSLTLGQDVIPNLEMLGGTISLAANFQGGTIDHLYLRGPTLSGNYTVTGFLDLANSAVNGSLLVAGGGYMNWSGGTAMGPITVASNGVLIVSGNGTLSLQNALTNAGTVTWDSGAGLDVQNESGIDNGRIENLAGGLFDIQCDQTMYDSDCCVGINPYFRNAGTVLKLHTPGTTSIQIPFYNSGTVTVLEGTLKLNSGGTVEGTFSVAAGATNNWAGGSFSYQNGPLLTGPGAIQFTGGSLTLRSNTIPNLALLGGTVTLGTNFQGGTITNLTLPGSTLSGNYTVSGVLNCNGGTTSGSLLVAPGATMDWSAGTVAGPLTIASNALLNIIGSNTCFLVDVLTNAGTVTWAGAGASLDVRNQSGTSDNGSIENLPGGLWNIQNDQTVYNSDCCVGLNPYFRNAGTVQKLEGTNTTTVDIPFLNSGTVNVVEGALALNDGFTPSGGTLGFGLSSLNNFGQINIAGNAALTGAVSVVWLGGFVPALSNSFPVLTYGSFSGAFSSLSLPSAAQWQANYGATAFSVEVSDVPGLAFLSSPQETNAGAVLAPVVVQVQDSATSSPIATNGVPVAVALASGNGELSGTLTQRTDTNGRATFNDLRISLAGTNSLLASALLIAPAASQLFAITASSPARLALLTPISSPQLPTTAFSPKPIVQVQDQFGNAITNSTAVISAAVTAGGGGSLGGSTSANVNGTNGCAVFTNLFYNLARTGTAEQVSVYFAAPGLAPVTNPPLLVAFTFSAISLSNGNSQVQIDPTTQRGMFAWAVDGTNQAYQHWFWLGLGSDAPPASIDNLGTPWGLLATSNQAIVNYFGNGLSVAVSFLLQGGLPGSETSTITETITLENTTNLPIPLQFFNYSDFDLVGNSGQDALSYLVTNVVIQQGKGVMLTQTIALPPPSHWEASYYAVTLDKLDGASPVQLSDSDLSTAPGDQTFAYQWNSSLGAGQILVITFTNSIGPVAVQLPRLDIALVAGEALLSWATNGTSGFVLQASASLAPGSNWANLTNTPAIVNGRFQVAAPPLAIAQFYRLKQ